MCPFATLLGLGAMASGSDRLLVKDKRFRAWSWLGVALLAAAWSAYFVAWRRHELRVALEVLSVLALVVGAARVWVLVRSGQVAPLASGPAGRALAALAHAVRSPWVVGAKVWLAAMITFELLDRASFTPIEYAVVTVALLALVAVRLLRREAGPRYRALAGFASQAAPAACPLGFGCAAPRAAASPLEARDDSRLGGFPS